MPEANEADGWRTLIRTNHWFVMANACFFPSVSRGATLSAIPESLQRAAGDWQVAKKLVNSFTSAQKTTPLHLQNATAFGRGPCLLRKPPETSPRPIPNWL
jgi:hypothetical protein